jgi:hypothetical protein
MNKPNKISVKHNIWGNYACFIGKERVATFGEYYDAMTWLLENLDTELHVLSDKSYITKEDVDACTSRFC